MRKCRISSLDSVRFGDRSRGKFGFRLHAALFLTTNNDYTESCLLELDASNAHLALARSPETNTTRTAE